MKRWLLDSVLRPKPLSAGVRVFFAVPIFLLGAQLFRAFETRTVRVGSRSSKRYVSAKENPAAFWSAVTVYSCLLLYLSYRVSLFSPRTPAVVQRPLHSANHVAGHLAIDLAGELDELRVDVVFARLP